MIRNLKNKMLPLLLALFMIMNLTACQKFDASAYVKAILDNSYLNDATAFVSLEIGSQEEAFALYEKGIDAEVQALLNAADLSEENQSAYRTFYEEMYKKVRYNVLEATKIDKQLYEVTISYEKMNLFAHAMEAYTVRSTELMDEWSVAALTGSEPTQQEMMDILFMTLNQCMKEALDQATFDEANTTIIRVELQDEQWTLNQEDLSNFEMLLFDFDKLQI